MEGRTVPNSGINKGNLGKENFLTTDYFTTPKRHGDRNGSRTLSFSPLVNFGGDTPSRPLFLLDHPLVPDESEWTSWDKLPNVSPLPLPSQRRMTIGIAGRRDGTWPSTDVSRPLAPRLASPPLAHKKLHSVTSQRETTEKWRSPRHVVPDQPPQLPPASRQRSQRRATLCGTSRTATLPSLGIRGKMNTNTKQQRPQTTAPKPPVPSEVTQARRALVESRERTRITTTRRPPRSMGLEPIPEEGSTTDSGAPQARTLDWTTRAKAVLSRRASLAGPPASVASAASVSLGRGRKLKEISTPPPPPSSRPAPLKKRAVPPSSLSNQQRRASLGPGAKMSEKLPRCIPTAPAAHHHHTEQFTRPRRRTMVPSSSPLLMTPSMALAGFVPPDATTM